MNPRRLSTGILYTPRGSMVQRVTLLNQPGRDSQGHPTPATTFLDNVPAAISSLQGRELLAAQQIVQEVSHKIIIPFVDGVKENMTVVFRGRNFQILWDQDPDERRFELQLFCVERNSSAQ
jgi:SPP1 family predicted phage head-tail adaptor